MNITQETRSVLHGSRTLYGHPSQGIKQEGRGGFLFSHHWKTKIHNHVSPSFMNLLKQAKTGTNDIILKKEMNMAH